MRLMQLARKLGVKQTDIISSLSSNGYEISDDINTKLTEDQIEIIYSIYLPKSSSSSSNTIESSLLPETKEAEATEESTLAINDETPSTIEAETPNPTIDNDDTEGDNVIRAKKIKLEGIKVLGKIELPITPDKKAKPEKDNEELSKRSKYDRSKQKYNSNQKNRKYNKKKPLSLEQRQRIKERQEKKKKALQAKLIKEKKTKHYLDTVQNQTQQRTSKKKKKSNSGLTNTRKSIKKNNNFIVRFWEWLNGKYD